MDRPSGIDPSVWQALLAAQTARAVVTVSLRAPAGSESVHEAPLRKVTGRLERIEPARDGRARVVLVVSADTEQHVLVDRIARVRVATAV